MKRNQMVSKMVTLLLTSNNPPVFVIDKLSAIDLSKKLLSLVESEGMLPPERRRNLTQEEIDQFRDSGMSYDDLELTEQSYVLECSWED